MTRRPIFSLYAEAHIKQEWVEGVNGGKLRTRKRKREKGKSKAPFVTWGGVRTQQARMERLARVAQWLANV
ncbi:hypothetical protein K1T71_009892 [Dendrolimus kikuchii]|uniref:Uncharacterized protein n=1 Tax=Dendrolimus kikuchii TaxID=765133 RepID=A0ACC1CT01_9NEOP|nr:hypothetical protein K1T71_009892 [Dendrolimus kikuchii]